MQNFRFDHVHICSNDPVGVAEFYEKMFGAEKVEAPGNTLIEVIQNK